MLTFSDEGKRDAYSSSQPYSRAVARAGGVPVLVPPIHELASQRAHGAAALRRRAAARRRRRRPAPLRRRNPTDDNLYGITEIHDELDIAVCLAAIELDLPMLALCRGMQVLNVALGGTLQQDIGTSDHWMREHPVDAHRGLPHRRRRAAPPSSSTATPCTTRASTASADPLVACGWATDGQLEAVELSSATLDRRRAVAPGGHRVTRRRSSRRCTTSWCVEPPHVPRPLRRLATVNPLVLIVGRLATEAKGVRGEPFAAGRRYFEAVARAGGMPLMLPPIPSLVHDVPDLLRQVDAVRAARRRRRRPAPLRPGADRRAAVRHRAPSTTRSSWRWCAPRSSCDVPMLAICRGMQVLNVALGGTLQQDIGSESALVRATTR